MTDSVIDEHYEAARKAGAIGGKLMGAGGGGFFMFYVRPADKRRVYEAMTARGLRRCASASTSTARASSPTSTGPDARSTPMELLRRSFSTRASRSSRPSTPTPSRRLAAGLAEVRDEGGRLFILGVGGSAGHAGHAVNDFRKICGFEAYAPTDNVSELTARMNDEGWDTCVLGVAEGLAPRRQGRRS